MLFLTTKLKKYICFNMRFEIIDLVLGLSKSVETSRFKIVCQYRIQQNVYEELKNITVFLNIV